MDVGGQALQIAGMFELKPLESANKTEVYTTLETQLRALLHGETDFIANCANMVALLWRGEIQKAIVRVFEVEHMTSVYSG